MCSVSKDDRPVKPCPVLPTPAPPKTRKPLAAVAMAVAYQWVSKPILPTEPGAPFWSGLLIIGDGPAAKCYMVTPIVGDNGTDKPGVIGWMLTEADGHLCAISAESWRCDCGESDCLDASGLRAGLEEIALAEPEFPEPGYDAFAADPRANWRYEVTGDEPPELPDSAYFDPDTDLA
jgi:hypothetical protein